MGYRRRLTGLRRLHADLLTRYFTFLLCAAVCCSCLHECLSASFVCKNDAVHSLSHIMYVVVVLACTKVMYGCPYDPLVSLDAWSWAG